MTDMLVKLYDLPDHTSSIEKVNAMDVIIRRPLNAERDLILNWIEKNFSKGWRDEVNAAFTTPPVHCFVATQQKDIVGFACYNVTAKGYFGPTGVIENMRGKGIGRVLMMHCFRALINDGYAYVIIGGIGPQEYYKKYANATVIENSTPGIYKGQIYYPKNQ